MGRAATSTKMNVSGDTTIRPSRSLPQSRRHGMPEASGGQKESIAPPPCLPQAVPHSSCDGMDKTYCIIFTLTTNVVATTVTVRERLGEQVSKLVGPAELRRVATSRLGEHKATSAFGKQVTCPTDIKKRQQSTTKEVTVTIKSRGDACASSHSLQTRPTFLKLLADTAYMMGERSFSLRGRTGKIRAPAKVHQTQGPLLQRRRMAMGIRSSVSVP